LRVAGFTIGDVDLLIREDDGWEELEEFQNSLADAQQAGRANLLSDLWRAVGQGQSDAAAELLDDLGFDLGGEVDGVKIVSEPDDMRGDVFQVWVRYEEP
jgi:hypothetical protein